MTDTQPEAVELTIDIHEVALALLGAIDLANAQPEVFGSDAAELCSVWCMLTGYDPMEEEHTPEQAVAIVQGQAQAVIAGTATITLAEREV